MSFLKNHRNNTRFVCTYLSAYYLLNYHKKQTNKQTNKLNKKLFTFSPVVYINALDIHMEGIRK